MNSNTIIPKGKLLDMARELGLALASSQEIMDYREAERVMAIDPEACRLTRIFKQTHVKLAALHADPDSSEEDRVRLQEELERADNEMKAYPLIADYYKAGSAFNTLIYQINQLLKFYTMEPGEDSQFESAGGCSSCSGCSSK